MSKPRKNQGKHLPAINLLRSKVQLLAPDMEPELAHVAIVATRFHQAIVDQLVQGAITALTAAGVPTSSIVLARVPGAWELPAVAARFAESGSFDAIVALGCIIRGETAHFDVIVNESAHGLMQVSVAHAVAVGNGVLACENEDQALARAGGALGNKGAEAAQAALEAMTVMTAIDDHFAPDPPDVDLLDEMPY